MAFRRSIFSRLILSGIVNTARYPLIAATMARPSPVFPLVGSMIVPPGLRVPFASASYHLLADAVLHAPSGIHHLELRQDETLHTVHDLRQLDEGRVPDGLQNARIIPHGRPREHQRSDVIRTCAPRCHSPVGIPDLPLSRDNRDVPGEGVEPPGNRSAVGHISRSV